MRWNINRKVFLVFSGGHSYPCFLQFLSQFIQNVTNHNSRYECGYYFILLSNWTKYHKNYLWKNELNKKPSEEGNFF